MPAMNDFFPTDPAETPSFPAAQPLGKKLAVEFSDTPKDNQAGTAGAEARFNDQTRAIPPAPILPSQIIKKLAALSESAAQYAKNASGPGTQAAYRSAWKIFSAWCTTIGREPLSGDPGLLALYLTKRAEDGLTVSSLQVARAAIRAAHRLAGIPLNLEDPRLGLVMEGIVRTHGVRPRRRAAPAIPDILRRLLTALPAPNTPDAAAPALAARHRAMLLIGFGAALRRSEIVALSVDDITVVDNRGLTVLVRRSKTDQHGQGRTIAIWANHRDPDFCPLAAYEAWMAFRRAAPDGAFAPAKLFVEPPALSAAGLPDSDKTDSFLPVSQRSALLSKSLPTMQAASAPHATTAWEVEKPFFCGITSAGGLMRGKMSDKVVARLMKQACVLAGLDPKKFSGHSLRRGLLTAAGDLQLPLVDLMRQSRHRSVHTALGYIESGDAWRNNITEPVFGGGHRTG